MRRQNIKNHQKSAKIKLLGPKPRFCNASKIAQYVRDDPKWSPKRRLANSPPNGDMQIVPQTEICKWTTNRRCAYHPHSGDVHIVHKTEICISSPIPESCKWPPKRRYANAPQTGDVHIVPKINSHSGDVHIVPKINSYNWLPKRRFVGELKIVHIADQKCLAYNYVHTKMIIM